MSDVLGNLFDLDWKLMLIHTIQMGVAFVLVLPVGLNRESKENIGLRTFPLVSLASCCFALIGFEVEKMHPDDNVMGEIINGIVTGIGFIGGGAILKRDGIIEGTSTAAAIWAAGCVGVAVAMGRLEIAVLVSLFTFLIFYFAIPIKKTIEPIADIKKNESQSAVKNSEPEDNTDD